MSAASFNDCSLQYPFPRKSPSSDCGYSSDLNIANRHDDIDFDLSYDNQKPYKVSSGKLNDICDLPDLSLNHQDISTNFTDNQCYLTSRELTDSSLNTARHSQRDMDIEKTCAGTKNSQNNKKDILNVFNKASDFWAEKFGLKKSQEDETRAANSPSSLGSQPSHPLSNSRNSQYNIQASQSDHRFAERSDCQYPSNEHSSNLYAARHSSDKLPAHNNALNMRPPMSAALQAQHSSNQANNQANNGRNNTLYKFLNQYFTGNDSTLLKGPSSQTQKTQRSRAQPQYQNQPVQNQPPQATAGYAPSVPSAVIMSSAAHLARYQQAAPKISSSSLRMKLEATQLTLPNHTRLQQMRDKTERKCAKKVWNSDRDNLLRVLVDNYGSNWEKIASEMKDPQITASLVQERYTSKLSPNIRKIRFSLQEDQLIAHYYQIYGPNWKQIVKYLPGRTESMVRNRFYSTIKKKKQNLLTEGGRSQNVLLKKMEECMNESQEDYNDDDNMWDQPYLEDATLPQDASQDNYFKDHRINYTSSVSNLDPMNLNNCLLDMPLKEGESRCYSKREENFKMIAEADPFMQGILNQSPAKNEVEFGCLSPIVNPSFHIESAWGGQDFYDRKLDNEDRFSFLNDKIDDVENDIANLRNFMNENCCNSLIDFNQDTVEHKNLTPETKSLCSKDGSVAGAVEAKAIPAAQEEEEAEADDSNNKISQLVTQIKSIEMLFDLTRKEIHKLQSEFGSK